MWIPILLFLLLRTVEECRADQTEGCQILQTTDPGTPCYILIRQKGAQVPPFIYMLNIPRATDELPCPASQTLDPTLTCYLPPDGSDSPAFVLNVSLPPNADELDESPAGKLRLREAKANPIFKPLSSDAANAQTQATAAQPTARLGPPSPHLTMAVFRPLTSSSEIKPPFVTTRTQKNFPRVLFSPKHVHKTEYHIIHYTTPFQRSFIYFNRDLPSSGVSYPYPASGRATSLNAI